MFARRGRCPSVAAATLAFCAAAGLVHTMGQEGQGQAGSSAITSAVETLAQTGRERTERGEYALARDVQQRVVTMRSAEGSPDALATALEDLAFSLIRLEEFDDADAVIARARALREPHETLAFIRTLELQAMVQRYRGDYISARRTLDRAFNLVSTGSLTDDRLASLLLVSADVAFLSGDMTRARTDYQSALDAARRAYGETHPALVPFLRKRGNVDAAFGDLGAARVLRQRAMTIVESGVPRCHPEAAAAMNDLALSDQYDGDYAGARRLLERALAQSRECLGPHHSSTATKLFNLGVVLTDLGDLARAEQLEREAVGIWSAGLGPEHPYVALGLESLAEVLVASGRLGEAATLYRRALEIRTKALGENNPTTAWTLTSRAAVYARQRRPGLALADLDRAAAIFARVPAVDEPDHKAQMLALRGRVERALGNTTAAREAYAAAVAERERIFGAMHPLVAEARTQLAAIDAVTGGADQALEAALAAEGVARDHMRDIVRYLPERQALEFIARRPPALDVAVSLAASGDRVVATAAFDAVIRSRGIVFEELAARSRVGHLEPGISADTLAAFVAARQRYANLVVRSLREAVPRSQLEAARSSAEAAERSFAERSAQADTERRVSGAGLDAVLDALPARSALVAFVRYRSALTLADASDDFRYGAFVVAASDRRPRFIELGSASQVERLVRAWRVAVSRRPAAGSRTLAAAGTALRRAVWDPLSIGETGATRVLVVPEGALTVVSIAALPREGGGFMIEDPFVIHYLSAERDVVRGRDAGAASSALIVGGPSFSRGRPPAAVVATRAADECRSAQPLSFSDLPAARIEATEVSSMWAQNGAGETVLLSGAAATETAVKSALTGRRVIHLATHGFFLGSDCDSRQSNTRAVGGVVAANAPARPAIRNPLLLAGLAFAGANRSSSGDDDGILTAEEIASLDLHGTEWAVLSACDTGLGEIRSGEGVLGLRRAFQIAGARTVIMSLWSVEDQATRRWMQALYEARLVRGLDTADAVRAASLAVLAQRRAAGLSTHPFYWAAFVAAGDWR